MPVQTALHECLYTDITDTSLLCKQ